MPVQIKHGSIFDSTAEEYCMRKERPMGDRDTDDRAIAMEAELDRLSGKLAAYETRIAELEQRCKAIVGVLTDIAGNPNGSADQHEIRYIIEIAEGKE